MSYRTRLLLFNNFIQTLDSDIRTEIEEYVSSDYTLDDRKVISYFGLENAFSDYLTEYAA